MTEQEILTFVNSGQFDPSPELKEGDICWYPPNREQIEAGKALKMIYKSKTWEKYSDQTNPYGGTGG